MNQIFESRHAETADIDFALTLDDLLRERLADSGGVLEAVGGAGGRDEDARENSGELRLRQPEYLGRMLERKEFRVGVSG